MTVERGKAGYHSETLDTKLNTAMLRLNFQHTMQGIVLSPLLTSRELLKPRLGVSTNSD